MNTGEENVFKAKKSGKKTLNPGLRKTGYVASIIFLVIAIYILRHLREWGLTFLTEDFNRALFYIELSIYITIAANVLFFIYDNRWFKHLVQAVVNAGNALSTIMFYVIFPLAIENANWVKWIKIGLIVVFIITVISIIVELVKGIRYLANDPQAT
jgi:hypothetical protein